MNTASKANLTSKTLRIALVALLLPLEPWRFVLACALLGACDLLDVWAWSKGLRPASPFWKPESEE